jgi:hypothetical protein
MAVTVLLKSNSMKLINIVQKSITKMNSDKNTPRLLGAAFLIVFFVSILSAFLLTSVVGSGSISEILLNISDNLTLMRIYILVVLVQSIGIIVLAALLYIVFNKHYKIIALVALGFWLAEAITLAVSQIGAYALLPLSQEIVAAGAPEPSYYQTLGDFFYYGFDRLGYDIHMLFFCLGGILWYYLFYRSRYIPRVLSVWGLAAICLLSIPVLLVLYDRNFESPMILLAPYIPYELFLGVWLIVKGFNSSAIVSESAKTDINERK